jgi:hypothetical protein
MKRLTYGLLVLLAILHQDWWWWDDGTTMCLGFMPIGLAYHAGVSVAAACLWALAVRHCWPAHLDEADEEMKKVSG